MALLRLSSGEDDTEEVEALGHSGADAMVTPGGSRPGNTVPWGRGAGGGAPGLRLRMIALFLRPRIRNPEVSGLMGTIGVLLFLRNVALGAGAEVEDDVDGADGADTTGPTESGCANRRELARVGLNGDGNDPDPRGDDTECNEW